MASGNSRRTRAWLCRGGVSPDQRPKHTHAQMTVPQLFEEHRSSVVRVSVEWGPNEKTSKMDEGYVYGYLLSGVSGGKHL